MNNLNLLPSWLSLSQSINITSFAFQASSGPASTPTSPQNPFLSQTEPPGKVGGHDGNTAGTKDTSTSPLSDVFNDHCDIGADGIGDGDGDGDATQSICVIGGGPGGMFFCYHMDERMNQSQQQLRRQRQRQLQHQAQPETQSQPQSGTRESNGCRAFDIHCFERASSPGGVWRKANGSDTSDIGAVEMYDNLWTNGASHNMEFFDYTFDDHFRRPVTVYLPRKDVLDYIIARVTRHNPSFFDDYMHFNTEVQHVAFSDSKQKFEVTTTNLITKATTTRDFDYCVWSAGTNGKQLIPQDAVDMLLAGGFPGPILHSADTANLESTVKGKRILLVGGKYSAEDLALQAIKLGAHHVHIVSRSFDSYIEYTTSWPGNKVSVHNGLRILAAEGSTIHFEEVEWSRQGGYRGWNEIEGSLENIDAVIFCTGYHPATHMLSEDLLDKHHEFSFKIPDGWSMAENSFTEELGHVEPSPQCAFHETRAPANYYGLLIRNPRMMYFHDLTNNPLLDHDAFAWIFAAYITGELKIPTQADMIQHHQDRSLAEMDVPVLRKSMDANYDEVLSALLDRAAEEGDDQDNGVAAQWRDHLYKQLSHSIRLLADVMQKSSYPAPLGTYARLNDAGKRMAFHNALTANHRFLETADENASQSSKQWKTFRDYTDAEQFQSIHTGTKAAAMVKNWLEM